MAGGVTGVTSDLFAEPGGGRLSTWTSKDLLATALVARGSSEAVMVAVAGIEPVPTFWKRREPLVPRAKSRLAG